MQDALTMNFSGVACASVLHTTAALTTADLDPGTDLDLLDALNTLITERKWRHPHNPAHAPDHLLASIIGPSVTVPARDGRLMLGAWQRVVLIELDGPRTRNLSIMLLPSVTS
jgi:secondary thiamine-phosphate synthase enzyme